MSRSFKACYKNGDQVEDVGRFCGLKPKQAACKALTSIHKLMNARNKNIDGSVNFSLYETTKNSRHKTYYFSGERKKLDEPISIEITGKDGIKSTIIYDYNNVVKRVGSINNDDNYDDKNEKQQDTKVKANEEDFSDDDVLDYNLPNDKKFKISI